MPAGLTLQVTAVLELLITSAVNSSDWFLLRVALEGETLTVTEDISVIVAVAERLAMV